MRAENGKRFKIIEKTSSSQEPFEQRDSNPSSSTNGSHALIRDVRIALSNGLRSSEWHYPTRACVPAPLERVALSAPLGSGYPIRSGSGYAIRLDGRLEMRKTYQLSNIPQRLHSMSLKRSIYCLSFSAKHTPKLHVHFTV